LKAAYFTLNGESGGGLEFAGNSEVPKLPYTPYSENLKRIGRGGRRLRKVTLNGGFTCPNLDGTKARGGCTFCDNRSFSPSAGHRGKSITAQLEEGMEYLRSRCRAEKFIAYFQTYSGTYAPVERLRSLYEQVLAHPDVVGLAIGTRPDCITPEIVSLLEDMGSRTYLSLELGLQSAFDESLARVNRAHTFGDFSRTMELCDGRNFDLCIHVILGLPGESAAHYRRTACALNRWKYHSLKIHPLHVVKGTVLAGQYLAGEFHPLDRVEYLAGLVDFLERVPPDVGVQRFTGDAPKEMLLAPQWCAEKAALREEMIREFRKRGTWQGHALGYPFIGIEAPMPGRADEWGCAFTR